MKVYLDDERKAPEGWILVATALETIALLETGQVTDVSLDHDLGLEDEDGYDVLLWIEEKVFMEGFVPPAIKIHTANPAAYPRMKQAAEAIRKRVDRG